MSGAHGSSTNPWGAMLAPSPGGLHPWENFSCRNAASGWYGVHFYAYVEYIYLLATPEHLQGPSINAKHGEIAFFTLLMFYTTSPLYTLSRLFIYHHQYMFECFLRLGLLSIGP